MYYVTFPASHLIESRFDGFGEPHGSMSIGDLFLLGVRWLHLVSAAAWVGGSIFYLLVLRPALRSAPESRGVLAAATASEFRALVNTCIVVLVATGVILGFDRLSEGAVDAPYAVVLGVKSALSVWMFLLVLEQRRRSAILDVYRQPENRPTTTLGRISEAASGYNALVILGLVVFLLSDLLKVLIEQALTGG